MQSIQEKQTVILTGASQGLGFATLEILLKAGVNVVALQRTESAQLTSLADKYPGVLIISKGDAAVEVAMQSFGRLDALILNAGQMGPLAPVSALGGPALEGVKELFEVNFFSLISIISHALPYLRQREGKAGLAQDQPAGRIVLVSSGAATGGVTGWAAYNASKAAMNSLGRTLGNEEKEVVTVSVRPGTPNTDMQTKIRELGGSVMSASDHARFMGLHERGELLPPHEPGGVLAGLALKAPPSMSGTFVNWNDEEPKALQLKP
ncbi:NAD(P)-binding protein [Rhodotorula sp. JG-1b]|nr:NAD(P)-binding protein [Rhodotorula sp. JG-1b]